VDKNAIICLVICVLLAPAGRASNESANQTLDSLITAALERNPAIHAAEHIRSAARYQAKSVGWLPDPKLSVAVLSLPRTSFSFDETPMSGVSLGLSQSIGDLFFSKSFSLHLGPPSENLNLRKY